MSVESCTFKNSFVHLYRAVETSALEGEDMLCACLKHLQELSRSLDERKSFAGKMNSTISVVPGHHPFYDGKAEVSDTSLTAAWRGASSY